MFHAQLREGTASHDHDPLKYARRNQGASHDSRVIGPAAERLDVAAGRVGTTTYLGYSLRQIATAALISIPHSLLAGVEHVLYGIRRDPRVFEQGFRGHDSGHLARKVFQQDVREQGSVFVVGAVDDTGQGAVPQVKRKRARVRRKLLLNLRGRNPSGQVGQVCFVPVRVIQELLANSAREALLQPDQVEPVHDLEKSEELLFGHDFAVGQSATDFAVTVVPGPVGCPEFVQRSGIQIRPVREV